MTVIIKYPYPTKKITQEFFKRKDLELTNLDWAKWAGWFDTDGCFTKMFNKKKKTYDLFADLRLRDKQPVELFSDTFQASLRYYEGNTITPDGVHHIAKTFRSCLCGAKAKWFTENLSPYLIKEAKREYAGNLLEDTVRSKDFNTWTKDEVIHYLATVIEGDGSIQIGNSKNTKNCKISIVSNNAQYLANLVSIAASKLNVHAKFRKTKTYKTKRGTVTMHALYILCSRKNRKNLDFLKSLLKYNVMTLDRKKEKIQEFVTWVDTQKEKPMLESRV
jgi:hypothetical protein